MGLLSYFADSQDDRAAARSFFAPFHLCYLYRGSQRWSAHSVLLPPFPLAIRMCTMHSLQPTGFPQNCTPFKYWRWIENWTLISAGISPCSLCNCPHSNHYATNWLRKGRGKNRWQRERGILPNEQSGMLSQGPKGDISFLPSRNDAATRISIWCVVPSESGL